MSDKYILDGKTPKPATLMEWAEWMETADRHVAVAEIGGVTVSTVFLGLDHQFGDGPPLLFETMIFDGIEDRYQGRCSTWEEAEAQHEQACALARDALQAVPITPAS